MFYEGLIEYDVSRFETERAERRAAENWRFRHLKSRERQVLAAIVTSVLQLFLR
jgi:FixJ family two-component response regulator